MAVGRKVVVTIVAPKNYHKKSHARFSGFQRCITIEITADMIIKYALTLSKAEGEMMEEDGSGELT